MLILKKAGAMVLAMLFAASIAVPAALLGETGPSAGSMPEAAADTGAGAMQHVRGASADAAAPEDDADYSAPGTCTAYIRYYENLLDDVPGIVPDENGRFLMGTRVMTGLHEGQVLYAWDFVEDIPGHFFFDGWPLYLKITANPADNVMELCYFNRYDSEYTVNYYMMSGADLTADNWADALAPSDVRFQKFDSETFQDQRFNLLVKGDAYEYKRDGMYVIDSYPAQINLGTDPDDNVINILYTTAVDNAPLDREVVEVPEAEDGADDGDASEEPPTSDGDASEEPPVADGAPDGEAPDDGAFEPAPDDEPDGEAPDDGAFEPVSDLPEDTTFTKDELVSVLPGGQQADPELISDFTSADSRVLGNALSQTGDEASPLFLQLTAIAAGALAVALAAVFWRRVA